MTSIKSRLTHNSSLIFRIIILLMAIFNFEMLQCCVITGTGCHRGHHISGLTGCCAIVYMGAAILEQQEQLDYKESFPTTVGYHPLSQVQTRYPYILCKICERIYLQKDKLGLSGVIMFKICFFLFSLYV